jgi:hypothetical protein
MQRLGIVIALTAYLLAPLAGYSQNKVYRNISDATVEKILQSLELKYQKEERKNKEATIMFFDFKRGDQSYRLYNYQSDLWIECVYGRTMKAEDINRWNADAKFSRLVLIENKDKTMLSLESQLDCMGGVTEAVIKQYINRFEEETKRFSKFGK